MTAPATKHATYADLEALPDNLVGEIVDGELYASPRPAPRHARASSVLGGALGGAFDWGGGGPGGWFIIDEPELHLGGQVMVPDLAGWRRERMPGMPEEAFFEVAPDWVCEVLSPSTAVLDRKRKLPHYARAGVKCVWIVDPIAKMVEIYRLHVVADVSAWRLAATYSGDEKVRAEPFDAIELDLGALWKW
jgi:Uma2 family endonuclease